MKSKLYSMIFILLYVFIFLTSCVSNNPASSIYIDPSEVIYPSMSESINDVENNTSNVEDLKRNVVFQSSLDRDDYLSDRSFANFREINSGEIKEGVLYRTSNLISFNSRSLYSTTLAKSYDVKSIINLSDDIKSVKFKLSLHPNEWYQNMSLDKRVIELGLEEDYKSDSFSKGILEALIFISNNEAPYLLTGEAGVNRVGFLSIVLESLMGATIEEIEEDYMLSYSNLYNINKGSDESYYVNDIPYQMLSSISDGVLIRDKNLKKIAEDYLIKIGLTKEQIKKIRNNLLSS